MKTDFVVCLACLEPEVCLANLVRWAPSVLPANAVQWVLKVLWAKMVCLACRVAVALLALAAPPVNVVFKVFLDNLEHLVNLVQWVHAEPLANPELVVYKVIKATRVILVCLA